jgi:hypothetical protein
MKGEWPLLLRKETRISAEDRATSSLQMADPPLGHARGMEAAWPAQPLQASGFVDDPLIRPRARLSHQAMYQLSDCRTVRPRVPTLVPWTVPIRIPFARRRRTAGEKPTCWLSDRMVDVAGIAAETCHRL